MLQPKLDLLTQFILKTFDPNIQDLILCEEMNELSKALLKLRRTDKTLPWYESAVNNVREEMSHVIISVCVVRKVLGITEYELESEVLKKLREYGANIGGEK